MRTILTVSLCFVILLALASPVAAQKETMVSGKVTCAKCDLKIEKECATVVVAKEGGKDVIYYLDEKTGKANHGTICQGAKEGTVTGIVSEKSGKKYIAATKVSFKK